MRRNTYYEENPTRDASDRTEEADKVSARIAALLSERAFSFTPNEYISIHRKLFTGIYSHAGRIRDYNITKTENRSIRYYSYTAHCGKSVAVWDKCGDNSKEKYDILCDGEKIAEVKAQNSETQIYMTGVSGTHKIEVK